MNGVFPLELSSLPIIAGCLLIPPLIGCFVVGLSLRYDAKKQGGKIPPLSQSFQEIKLLLRKKNGVVPYEPFICILLALSFDLVALGMLGLQKNLLPILFLQSAGILAMGTARMHYSVPGGGRSVNCELKAFLTSAPLLILVAVGIFFATGSFSLAALHEYPRLLVIDLPFLWVSLLFIEQASRRDVNNKPTDPAPAFVKLANSYHSGIILLLAGFFFARSLVGAVATAVFLHMALVCFGHIQHRFSWRLRLKWGWGYLYFAVLLNLSWIYIKYWL
ncbi:MAG: hypothetical protein AB9917_22110 [Negativicutes bacterium]